MSRHRRNHPGHRALICALLAACGGGPSAPEPATTAPAKDETPIASLYDDSGILRAKPKDAAASTEPPNPPSLNPANSSKGPRRVGRRDVRLHGARLDDAFRALAVAGRFHLVVPEPLSQPIDLELVRVEPYDALVVLAEAHGLSVSYQRGVVIVKTPERAQP